jgi:MFS transporter, putative metabolite:H+ symporter
MTPNQVAARLDRLPLCRFHWRFLALVSLGAWFDFYDNFVAGALAAILPRAGVLPPTLPGEWISAVGIFSAALPLGMFVGTIFFGLATDHVGRRFGFIAMLLLYSLASFVGGAGYYAVVGSAGMFAGFVLLVATRFLAGAGIGGENVIIDAYISEMMPTHIRGRAIALAHAFVFTAMPVAAFLARWLAPADNLDGWPWLLVIGSLGALLSWYFRRKLPESPRWLASVGRGVEAEIALAEIESAVARDTGQPPKPIEVAPRVPSRRLPFRAIWSRPYLGRTVLLMGFQLLQTVGYYGFMHWIVTLLEKKGFDHNTALDMQFYSFLLAPVGPLLAVWSIERCERKWLLAGLALTLAVLELCLGPLADQLALVVVGAVIVVGCNWFSAVFHAYQAELFPTEARATGIGFTYAWSRASMAALNLFMPTLIAASLSTAVALMASAFLLVSAIIGLFGPLTNARALEEVSG